MNPVVKKYLDFYAESETALLSTFPAQRRYEHTLVIPAFKESGEFLEQYKEAPFRGTLIILVINQPASAATALDAEAGPHPDNIALAKTVNSLGSLHWHRDNLFLYNCNDYSILLVDRYSENRIPRKQGVGLARKIGCDIAVQLIVNGVVSSSLVHSTDADARLPRDYFQQVWDDGEISAGIYDFHHLCDESDVGVATKTYEQSIRYYVEGLKWAGSPYGFFTLGSCIAVSALPYCQARGFPKRSGGEDFYLLNKLVKLGKVVQAGGSPVDIAARVSARAPFGTGRGVSRLLSLPVQEHRDYNPEIFRELKQLIEAFPRLAECSGIDEYWRWLDSLSGPCAEALHALGVQRLFKHLEKQRLKGAGAIRHIHHWLDGFRTLKFIRFLQNHYYPGVPLDVARKHLKRG